MNAKQMAKEYDTLIHRTIPRDVGTEWKYYAQYQQLLHGDYSDAESDRLENLFEQCQHRTNAALKKAAVLHQMLQEKKMRVPAVPHLHRPIIY